MKKISFILDTFLVFGLFVSLAFLVPKTVSAATVFSDGFTAGSDPDDISGWNEEGTDNDSSTIPQPGAISGEDQVSPQGDLFAKIGEDDWICRTIDTSGHTNLFLHYFWRGDADAEDSESGTVEYRASGSCTSASGWTSLATHELDDGNNNVHESWSTMQSVDLSDSLNNSSFILRFRQSSSDSSEYFRVDGVLVKGDRLGNIAVRKVVTSPTKDKFDFSSNVEGSDNFSLGGGEKHKLGNLVEGIYTVTESQKDGYVLTGIYCDDETAEIDLETGTATVNVSLYEDITCTFTNEPIQLIVKKVFVGDEEAGADDFSFTVDKQGEVPPIGYQFEADGTNLITGLANGVYDVVEDSESGYTATYSSDRPGENANHCNNIPVDNGNGPYTCTITNSKLPTLTVIKHVVNDDNGTAEADDFSLIVNGVNANPAGQFPGSEEGTLVILGVGPYGVAESIAPGYGVPTFSEDCSGNMALGDEKTCTVTNDDVEPPQACVPELNLLENGGFETPVLGNGTWSIIPDSNPLLEWFVAWVTPQEGGTLGLEIQNNVAGSPASGAQHAELDGDHPVTIWQNIPTIVGEEYALNFNYSPRPGRNLADNSLQVKVDGSVLGANVATDGTLNGNTVWESISRTFTATNPTTKIEFSDNGTDTSFGGYLDNASLVCVPKQTPCEDVVSSQTLVSDDTTSDGDGYASELTFIHPAWTASIPDATWIWATDPVEAPTNDGDLTKVFTKTFAIVGTPTGGTLDVAADNNYSVKLNGNSLPVVFDQNNFQLATQDSYDVSSLLISGLNTLEITVTNWESAEQSADPASNPAGLLYKLSLNENACVPPPPEECEEGYHEVENECVPNYPDPDTATIYASKIVCDSEDDLPNWGEGSADITSTTVPNFLADDLEDETQDCHIEEWTFEWAPNGTSNPGDSVEAGGEAWTPFTTSVSVPAGSLVWLREQFDSNYIAFSGDTTEPQDQDVSAEFYCSDDVLNYDNYDLIDPVVAGQTYYCVGFNAPVVVDVCPYVEGNQSSTEDCPSQQELPQCSDDDDNDGDQATDSEDPGCHTDSDASNSSSYDPNDDDESDPNPPTLADEPSNPSSTSRDFRSGNGQVLGASTFRESCLLYMDRFIRFGSANNDVEQVKLLQTFLNKWMHSNLPITGVYGPQTLEVLRAFQEKFAGEVLTPWNLNGPTGLVYQTTLRWINMLECPDLAIQLPELIEWSKNPNVPHEPLASALPESNSNTPTTNNEEENVDEEGEEDIDLDRLPAAVGESESGGGLINFLKNLFGG
ncbi:MAG: peptidoglycan-binding protein [Patescibacteria group bacterium]